MNIPKRAAQPARVDRQLPAGSDSRQQAFRLVGALRTANWPFRLYADPGYPGRASRPVQPRPASEATPAGRRALWPAPQTGQASAARDVSTPWEQP